MDRAMFGLLAAVILVAVIAWFFNDPDGTAAGRRVGEAVRENVQETADRLGEGFDAAREDMRNVRRP